ncbi:MAG: DinB family protein [Blastocatellia bacterium]
MKRIDALKNEFARETETTRRQIARLPDDQLNWRPHEKSFTAGALAAHLVDCLRWTEAIFSHAELNLDPATYQPFHAASTTELLRGFDDAIARGQQALDALTDAALEQSWQFKINGKVRFARERDEVFRDFALSHLIHHRGQLSVYLRLLGVAVPGSYGPTADEQF